MKRHLILSVALIAGSALLSMAQTHKEGEEYYRAEQYDNALELLQRNYDKPGTDKSLSDYYMGMIYLKGNKISEAEKYFQKGLQEDPENGYNYVGMGQIALLNGDAKAAKKYFDDARKKNKKDASLDIAIARAYYDVDAVKYAQDVTKMQEQARKDSPKEGGIAPTNVDIYLFEGDILRDNKDYGNAGTKYEMAKNYNKDATEAYVKYGILFRDVRPTESIKLLKELLQVNPQSALGQRELARTYENQQMYKEAVEQYANYVNNPNHFKQDEDNYSLLLFFNNDYQKGYDYASKLLKENPQNFTAQRYQFINASQLDSMKDQLLPLAENLVAAHNANPANRLAQIDYTLIGYALSDAKRQDEAIALFNEAIQNDPTNREYYKQLSSVYSDLEDYEKAAQAYEGYIANSKTPAYRDYNVAAAYYYYAGLTDSEQNPDKAPSMYAKATENANKGLGVEKNAKSYKLLGDVARASAPTKDDIRTAAAPNFIEAVAVIESNGTDGSTNTDKKDMYSYLGSYYAGQGDNANALKYYQKYLELDPDNESVQKAVNALSN